ncbi:hypothetical protein ACOMHN_036320 [Nucella lapillus]
MIKRRRRVCVLFIIFISTLYLFFLTYSSSPKAKAVFPVGPRQGVNPFVTTFPPQENSSRMGEAVKKEKVILLWTQLFGSDDWEGTERDLFQFCSIKNCRVIMEEEKVGEADALLMSVRDIFSPADLPPNHPPHQVWILHGPEPPYYIYLDLEKFNNVFNWTSWYRTDADIFSPYDHFSPLGLVRDFKPQSNNNINQQQHHLGSWQRLNAKGPEIFQANFLDEDLIIERNRTHQDPISPSSGPEGGDDDKKVDGKEDFYSQHDLLMFWAASSCINFNHRYKLVWELQKFLPVDTFGDCGTMSCKKDTQDCQDQLNRYKFVLAFENGYCRDYVTEKYWNALDRNQIPIVSGGADYGHIAIPGSYIDVDTFTSVEQLAKFILRVSSNRTLYNSFFEWKSGYRTLGPEVCNWCQLCAALHDESRLPQVYSDLPGWLAEDTCPVYSPYQHLKWLIPYLGFKIFGI